MEYTEENFMFFISFTKSFSPFITNIRIKFAIYIKAEDFLSLTLAEQLLFTFKIKNRVDEEV